VVGYVGFGRNSAGFPQLSGISPNLLSVRSRERVSLNLGRVGRVNTRIPYMWVLAPSLPHHLFRQAIQQEDHRVSPPLGVLG
jgi:hypothetical protein